MYVYVYTHTHMCTYIHTHMCTYMMLYRSNLKIIEILSCMSWLYILEINALSVASFANIFSHSEGCLFVLFMISLSVQKLLSFIRSHLLGRGYEDICIHIADSLCYTAETNTIL